jgi:hypothetical protein
MPGGLGMDREKNNPPIHIQNLQVSGGNFVIGQQDNRQSSQFNTTFGKAGELEQVIRHLLNEMSKSREIPIQTKEEIRQAAEDFLNNPNPSRVLGLRELIVRLNHYQGVSSIAQIALAAIDFFCKKVLPHLYGVSQRCVPQLKNAEKRGVPIYRVLQNNAGLDGCR